MVKLRCHNHFDSARLAQLLRQTGIDYRTEELLNLEKLDLIGVAGFAKAPRRLHTIRKRETPDCCVMDRSLTIMNILGSYF